MRYGTTIDKKIMRQVTMWKDIFRAFFKRWIVHTSDKTFMRHGILLEYLLCDRVQNVERLVPPLLRGPLLRQEPGLQVTSFSGE